MTLVYAVNRGFKPADARHLKSKIKMLLGRSPLNVRVASSHVEVSAAGVEASDLVRVVESVVGEVFEVVEASQKPPSLQAYLKLMEEERYWEAHEILESLWSVNKDPGLQVLILAAASLAKAQEGSLKGALKILDRLVRLQNQLEEEFVDASCIREAVKRVDSGLAGDAVKCIKLI